MIPTKAYILKTTDPRSVAYAKDVADSCDKVGLKWEYLDWFQGKPDEAWKNTGIPKPKVSGNPAAQCCFSGHIAIWKKILDSGEAGIILEHDGIMLHPVNIDIPDNTIVVLGYKLANPNEYDHEAAGAPTQIVDVNGEGHEGSHAYAITPNTAAALLEEIKTKGATGAIDNKYFLKSRKTDIKIKIMSPTPAIGWIRESTIQKKSSTKNYQFIDSFQKHYIQGAAPKVQRTPEPKAKTASVRRPILSSTQKQYLEAKDKIWSNPRKEKIKQARAERQKK